MGRFGIRVKFILATTATLAVFAVAEIYTIRASVTALEEAHGDRKADTAAIMLNQIGTIVADQLTNLARITARPAVRAALDAANGDLDPPDGRPGLALRPPDPPTIVTPDPFDGAAAQFLRREFVELDRRLTARGVYAELALTDRVGRLVAATGPAAMALHRDPKLWLAARRYGRAVGDVLPGSGDGGHDLKVAVRLNDDDGRAIGLVAALLSAKRITREAAAATQITPARNVKLTTADGRLIFSTRPFRFFDDVSDAAFYRGATGERGFYTVRHDGRATLYAYARNPDAPAIGELSWTLFLASDRGVLLAEVYALQRRLLIGFAALVIAALALTVVLSRAVVRPILAIRAAAVAMADGALDARVEVAAADELGELSAAFNRMAARLEVSHDALSRLNAELAAKRQEAETASIAKSRFLANMSHDIRTPMNAIIGMTHLAQRTQLTGKQAGYLSRIESSAQSLLGIINDILDFSKIEAGKLEIDAVGFSIDDVIRRVSDLFSLAIEEKGLELVFSVAPTVPRYVTGDPLRIGQVLTNLVGNAIKFTDDGEIVVAVSPDAVDATSARLRFSVRDTGIGIAPDQQARLFQSFTRAASAATHGIGGTGLGLAICRQLCGLMGGEIWVSSVVGRGSVFTFTITVGVAAPPPDRTPGAPVAAAPWRGLKVLVVDDNASAREALADQLRVQGVAVDTAVNGAAALEDLVAASAAGTPYELVLMDWRMPGIDGIETARRIRADHRLSRLPAILVVTAFGREEVQARARDAGLDGFLVKPVTPSALTDTLTVILDRHGGRPAWVERRSGACEPGARFAGARALLVEDIPVNRELALELLTGLGMTVAVAETGRVAVDRARCEPFDVVLMDIQMPEMDGLTATRLIRAEPHLKSLPIIAMTAHAMSGDREKSLDAGMNDHVTKPIDPDTLAATLARWVTVAPPSARRPDRADGPAGNSDADADAGPPLPPILPPFDLAAARVHTNNNLKLLRHLLIGFRNHYAGAVAQMRRLIAADQRLDAERTAHSLAGTAATLGAGEVSETARALEHALRAGEPGGHGDLIDRLDRALAPALHAIAGLRDRAGGEAAPPAPPTPAGRAIAGRAIDARTLAARLAELRRQLAGNDLAACCLFAALAPTLAARGHADQVAALTDELDRLAFQAALKRLDSLTAALARSGDAP